MKQYLKVSAIALVFTVSIQSTQISVYAEGLDELGQVVDGSLLTNDPCVEDSVIHLERGSLLMNAKSRLVVPEYTYGQLIVKGETGASLKADKIYLGLILEQKMFGEWFEYCRWNINGEDRTSIIQEFQVPVEQGYYYRLKGIHSVEKAGNVQLEETLTPATWLAEEK